MIMSNLHYHDHITALYLRAYKRRFHGLVRYRQQGYDGLCPMSYYTIKKQPYHKKRQQTGQLLLFKRRPT